MRVALRRLAAAPTRSSTSNTCCFRCARSPMLWILRPSPTMSPTLILGSSEPTESWKTICMCLRISFRDFPLSPTTSTPSKRISPAVGSSSRSSVRPSVDLPQPDSPTSRHSLARIDVEIDPVDGLKLGDRALEHPLLDGEVLPHPLGREQSVGKPRRRGRRRHASRARGVGAHVAPPTVWLFRAPFSQSQQADSCAPTWISIGSSVAQRSKT